VQSFGVTHRCIPTLTHIHMLTPSAAQHASVSPEKPGINMDHMAISVERAEKQQCGPPSVSWYHLDVSRKKWLSPKSHLLHDTCLFSATSQKLVLPQVFCDLVTRSWLDNTHPMPERTSYVSSRNNHETIFLTFQEGLLWAAPHMTHLGSFLCPTSIPSSYILNIRKDEAEGRWWGPSIQDTSSDVSFYDKPPPGQAIPF
jgi:hypothetical protein